MGLGVSFGLFERRRRLVRVALAVATLVVMLSVSTNRSRAEADMTFRSVPIGQPLRCGGACPMVIAASGQITEHTPDAFAAFLGQHADGAMHTVVFLDSPGGSVLAAMEFGMQLRRIGAAAVVARVARDGAGAQVPVNAQCFSACVYAFVGAQRRVIPPESQVGIHRMFLSIAGLDAATQEELKRGHYDNVWMRNRLASYTRSMGVSADLIARAERIPSQELHILSRAEIRKWHLGVAEF